MHLVDSSEKKQLEEGNVSSSPLPLQSLASGEKLQRPAESSIEVFKLKGADIHLRLFPAPETRAVAVYLHGIEGHSLWFANTAQVLNASGIAVYAPDRRGAGLNFSERGHVDRAETLVEDVEFFLKIVAERNPSKPLILIGNCWGAKVAAIIAAKTKKETTAGPIPKLDGLVLICPAIKTKPDLSLWSKLSIVAALISGQTKAQLPIPLTCSMFTDNPVFLHYIEKDPLRLSHASKAFYFASFILSLKSAGSASSIKIPTLVLQSDRDEIVDVAGIDSWFSKIAAQDKTLKKYSGALHSMDFDKRHFFDYASDLKDWIIARVEKRGIPA